MNDLLPSFLTNLFSQDKSEKIDKVNTLNPTLRWLSVKGANKYQLAIKEYERKDQKSKPIIIRTFELTDTFFVLPNLVLQNQKLYSWNVRAFDGEKWGDYGEEFYFYVDLQPSKASTSYTKPVIVSPGDYYPKIQIIKKTNPQFFWLKYSEADRYVIEIEKQEKSEAFNKIFSSEKTHLITDTFFVIKENLLQPNTVYRWRIKAITSLNTLSVSDYKYFKILFHEKLVVPQILYPGFKDEGHEIIGTKTPTFIWNKIDEAESYSLLISRKETDGKYKLIFESDATLSINDTTFVLPENILENHNSYKWNLKVRLKDGRIFQSNELYFKVLFAEEKRANIPISKIEPETEVEEILLNMEYAGILKTLVSSVYSNAKIFISLNHLLKNLQIPFSFNNNIIEVSTSEGIVVIDFNQKKIKSANFDDQIYDKDFLDYSNEYFLSIKLLEKVLSIKIELDFSNLTIQIFSDNPLPVYSRYLLEQRYKSLRKSDIERKYPLLFKRERNFVNGFIVDYSLNHTLVMDQRSNYSYSAALGGELLYGDFYYQRQEYHLSNLKSTIENYNWKFTFNPNKYLTQISLGDEYFEGINSYTYRGLSITNEVVEPRKKIGNFLYQGKTEPNSLIELYINNELVSIARADDEGNYSFEIPLRYGMSNLEFRINTTKGETKILRRIFNIPYDLLPSGVLNYKATAGLMKFTNHNFGFAEIGYGIKNNLTLSVGSEYIKEQSNKYLNFFYKSSLRLFSNLFLSGFYSPKLFTRIQGSFIQPDYTSYIFEFTNFKKNKFYNPTNLRNSLRGNFYLPIHISKGDFGFYLSHEYLNSDVLDKYSISFNTYYFYNWVGFNLGVLGENQRAGNLIKRREINLGTTLNFNNLLRDVPVVNRSYLSFRSNYNLLNNNVQNVSVFTTTNLAKNIRLQMSYERLFKVNTTNFSLNLFFELPQTRYVLNSNASDVLNHQLSGSVGYVPQANLFYLYREAQIGRSSIYIEGFEDRNGNTFRDKDEQEIRGLDFLINSASYSKKIKDGKLFLSLNPYHEYTISLNEANQHSFNYSFESQEFNFMTDGNRTKVVRLPFYETGEVGGLVVRKFEKEEIPLTNVRLIIINLADKKEVIINTFSDGSFYHYGLRKGKYLIRIDQNYLEQFSLKSTPAQIEFEINPTKNQLTIEDLKLVLE